MKVSKKWFFSLIAGLLCVILTMSSAFAYTEALTSSTALRNRIAKNWTFLAQGLQDYNCLAWALGITTTWVWPWGQENPTLSEVNDYMSGLGYEALSSNISCDIYAYGTSSAVAHFSRGRGAGPLAVPIDAKWGAYELFTHTSTNPYYTIEEGGVYGRLVKAYHPA